MYGSIVVHMVDAEEFKGGFSTTGTLTPTVSLERCAFDSNAICLTNVYAFCAHTEQSVLFSLSHWREQLVHIARSRFRARCLRRELDRLG